MRVRATHRRMVLIILGNGLLLTALSLRAEYTLLAIVLALFFTIF